MALLYGLSYLIVSSFAELWTNRYYESIQVSGRNYIAVALGTFTGAQAGAIATDLIYKKLCARNNGLGLPKFRIPLMFLGAALVLIGLFWFDWSADATLFWIMSDVGIEIFGCGFIISYTCIQTCIMDAYALNVASVLAAVTFVRSLTGYAFPLFALAM
jgi:hypothetical protein